MRAWATGLLTSVFVSSIACPLAAQRAGGVFDQPYQPSPFAPLVSGHANMVLSGGGQIGNNTLNIGDLVAITKLNGNFRFNDLFLIGGLIPDGEGLQGDAYADARLAFFLPISPRLDIGFGIGGRGQGTVQLPEEIATFIRDGVDSAPFEVDLTGFRASALAYTEIGGLAVVVLPTPLLLPEARVRLGAGVRYLRGIGFDEINFDGDGAGAQRTNGSSVANDEDAVSSSITVSHDGIQADVTSTVPIGFTAPGGSGYAFDLMAAVDVGGFELRATATGIGRVDVRRGRRAVGHLIYRGNSVQDFLNAMDAMPTDTLEASPETVTLPTTLRLEASTAIRPDLLVGVAVERDTGGPFAHRRSISGIVELRPRDWLALRGGSILTDGYTPAVHGGFGLELRLFRFDTDVAVRGGLAPDKYRRAHLRAGFSIPFRIRT